VIVTEAAATAATLNRDDVGECWRERLFEGNVTEDVIRKSDVPVRVVRVADDEF